MTLRITDPNQNPFEEIEGFNNTPQEARQTRIILSLLSAAGDEGIEEELLLRLSTMMEALVEYELLEAQVALPTSD